MNVCMRVVQGIIYIAPPLRVTSYIYSDITEVKGQKEEDALFQSYLPMLMEEVKLLSNVNKHEVT